MKLLPGESRGEYRAGLQQAISELGASTHLQVYLVEKIFDCLWWIRRLESQKSGILLNRMLAILDTHLNQGSFRRVIENEQWDDHVLKKVLSSVGLSLDAVMAESARKECDMMRVLDQQIGDWVKTLRGLQMAYEALVNRKLMIERLQLQNRSLRRDVDALAIVPPSTQGSAT